MLILSHRGYWKQPEEKNQEIALRRSFALGFGTETDVRDLGGTLVVSHDPPRGGELTFETLLDIHEAHDRDLPLALNVKSDGLQSLLAAALAGRRLRNYFFFDMSTPDCLGYTRSHLPVFTRQSEFEQNCLFYEQAVGVWVDAFTRDWLDEATLAAHLDAGKLVCVVSPELHGRDPQSLWKKLADMPLCGRREMMLCTDFPEDAAKLFASVG